MYMRQYAWRIIRISKEILQIFSHYFAESATRRRLPQAISMTCGDAPTRRRKKRLRKMEVGLTTSGAKVLFRSLDKGVYARLRGLCECGNSLAAGIAFPGFRHQ